MAAGLPGLGRTGRVAVHHTRSLTGGRESSESPSAQGAGTWHWGCCARSRMPVSPAAAYRSSAFISGLGYGGCEVECM